PHNQNTWVIGSAAHSVIPRAEAATNQYSQPGYRGTGHTSDQFGSMLGDTFRFITFTHHKPSNILQKNQRYPTLYAQHNKMRPLKSRFTEQNAIVGKNPDRVPLQVGKSTDQCRSIACLELVKLRCIN